MMRSPCFRHWRDRDRGVIGTGRSRPQPGGEAPAGSPLTTAELAEIGSPPSASRPVLGNRKRSVIESLLEVGQNASRSERFSSISERVSHTSRSCLRA